MVAFLLGIGVAFAILIAYDFAIHYRAHRRDRAIRAILTARATSSGCGWSLTRIQRSTRTAGYVQSNAIASPRHALTGWPLVGLGRTRLDLVAVMDGSTEMVWLVGIPIVAATAALMLGSWIWWKSEGRARRKDRRRYRRALRRACW